MSDIWCYDPCQTSAKGSESHSDIAHISGEELRRIEVGDLERRRYTKLAE